MKKINFLLLMSILICLFYACDSESFDIQKQETFKPEQVLSQGIVEQTASRKKSLKSRGCAVISPECAYPNQSLTYTYSTTSPNPNIVWTIVSGSISIASGQGTNTAALLFGSDFTGGFVNVTDNGSPSCSVLVEVLKCPIGTGNDCGYVLGILDEYLDGTQSGADFVYLNAGGNFPLGTTYTWTIKRQNGSTQYYPASTNNPRKVSASINNRITQATVTAEYSGCQKTVAKTFLCAIPNADANGDLFPECYFNNGGLE